MMKMTGKNFDRLTAFIGPLKQGDFGEWISEPGHKGTVGDPVPVPYVKYSEIIAEFADALDDFMRKNPEYSPAALHSRVKKYFTEWNWDTIDEADVSKMDSFDTVALLVEVFRAERFCDGLVLEKMRSGVILKWLERLKETVDQ